MKDAIGQDAIGQEIHALDSVAFTCLGREAPVRYSVLRIADNGLVTIIRNSCDVRTVYPSQVIVVTPETSEDVLTRSLRRLLNDNERLRPAVAAMQKAGHNAAEIIETLFPGN